MAYQIAQKINIRNVKDLHAELAAVVEQGNSVELDAGHVTDCDLSLIQLIESARRSACAMNKPISLIHPANDAILATLFRAGLIDGFSAEDAKFWLHKEMN